jgi:hypothetical protein
MGRLSGLSGLTGNCHGPFLGGWGPAMAPGYPTAVFSVPSDFPIVFPLFKFRTLRLTRATPILNPLYDVYSVVGH